MVSLTLSSRIVSGATARARSFQDHDASPRDDLRRSGTDRVPGVILPLPLAAARPAGRIIAAASCSPVAGTGGHLSSM
jgi:hypothetical protein